MFLVFEVPKKITFGLVSFGWSGVAVLGFAPLNLPGRVSFMLPIWDFNDSISSSLWEICSLYGYIGGCSFVLLSSQTVLLTVYFSNNWKEYEWNLSFLIYLRICLLLLHCFQSVPLLNFNLLINLLTKVQRGITKNNSNYAVLIRLHNNFQPNMELLMNHENV